MKGQLASLSGKKKGIKKNKNPHLALWTTKMTKENRKATRTCSWWQLSLQRLFVSSTHIPFEMGDTTGLLPIYRGEDAITTAFGERSVPLMPGWTKRLCFAVNCHAPSLQRESWLAWLGIQHFPRKLRQALSLSSRYWLHKSPSLQWLIFAAPA